MMILEMKNQSLKRLLYVSSEYTIGRMHNEIDYANVKKADQQADSIGDGNKWSD